MNRVITSREYKLMLNADRLADRARGSAELWRLTELILAKAGGEIVEQQNEEEERRTPPPATLSDLTTLFPKQTFGLPAETPIEIVNGFIAHEVARKVAKVRFEESTVVKLALSFWYLHGAEGEFPVVGEFSFDYDLIDKAFDGLEKFSNRVVAGANTFFTILQRQSRRFDPSGTTKTAAVYEAF